MGQTDNYYLQNQKLIDFKQQLKAMLLATDQVMTKRQDLIEFTGKTDKEAKELDSKINPECYYQFKLFDHAVAIVYTNWWYDTETETTYKSPSKYHYSIKYYNCYSQTFKDKRCKLPYCYANTCYGDFKTLNEAKSYFRRAVVDILVQYGNCKALNPFDFL